MKRLALAVVLAAWGAAGGAWATTGIGVTSAVLPQATGTPPDGEPRVLNVGTDVVVDERIVTGKVGKTHLLFLDGSALTVGPGSDLVLDEFVYDADAKSGKIAMTASKGLLRFVGGRISKTTPVLIKTPSATIGIRGGIAIVEVGAVTTAKFLFGEELTVSAGGITRVVTRPGFQISVTDGAPETPVPADPRAFAEDVDQLEGHPGHDGPGEEFVDDDDVGERQLGDLGSRREPFDLEREDDERDDERGDRDEARDDFEGPDDDPFGDDPLNDDFRDDRFEDMADAGTGGLPPPPSAGVPGNIGDAIPDTQSVMPFDDLILAANAENSTVIVTVRIDDPTLGSFSSASLSAAGFSVAADGSLMFFGTPEDAEDALDQLVFVPTPNQAPPGQTRNVTFSVLADDGFGNVTSTQTSITTFSVNDAPTLAGTVGGQSVTDKAQIAPFTAVVINDPDVGETVTVTVRVTSAGAGGFTATSLSASGFVDQGGGVYRFTGTPAQAQAALRTLSFDPAENQTAVGGNTTATFTITANDGDALGSDAGTTVVIASLNDAPVLNTLAATVVAPVTSITPLAGITVVDPDVGASVTATVQIDSVAKGSFTTASVAAAGFTDLGGGTYRFNGTPAQAQAAIRQLAFLGADGRVTTGNSETVQFTVSINDGNATTPATYTTSVTCSDLCRYDLSGRVKLGNDTNIGTDDVTAASNRPLVTTSTISGNRFKATTAQGTYELFLPTQGGGAAGTNFSFGGAGQPAVTPEGSATGNGFLAANADFLFYEIAGSRQFLFAGKPVSGFSFNDATFFGAKYDLIADFTLGGSRIPFIPQTLLNGVANPANPTLTVLFGSGNAADHRFFHGGAVTISGTGGAQRAAGSVLVGLAVNDPSGSFHLSGSMAGVVTGGAAGDQPIRILSPVATVDDGSGNDVFGGANPRFMVLESASVSPADAIQNRGGRRYRGPTLLTDPIFANQPALNTAAAFTTFTGAATGPNARTGGSVNGFAGGVSFDRDSVGNPEGVRGFYSKGIGTDMASGVSITRSLASNRISMSMKLESKVVGGFSFGGSVDTILSYGGASEAGRSAFEDNNTYVALDNATGGSQINGATGTMEGFIVTRDQVTFANGAIPAGVTICTCADITWGFFNAFMVDSGGVSYEIPLAQWVAGEQANAGQITGLNGTATYDGSVIATIAIGDSVNPNAVSRYTTAGSFSFNLDINSGSTNLIGGSIDLDGANYSLSPSGPAGASPGEYYFSISGPAGRFGDGSGDLFGPGSPPSSTAGRFYISNGSMPTYQAGGIYFGQNTAFTPGM